MSGYNMMELQNEMLYSYGIMNKHCSFRKFNKDLDRWLEYKIFSSINDNYHEGYYIMLPIGDEYDDEFLKAHTIRIKRRRLDDKVYEETQWRLANLLSEEQESQNNKEYDENNEEHDENETEKRRTEMEEQRKVLKALYL